MKLFSSFRLGRIDLANRIAMAPMTRSRATDGVPNRLIAEYYNQRAKAGLIVTEGTSPSPNGMGYARIPGIYSEQQVSGWKIVTEAVHAAGGRIFIQLMHCGRVCSLLNMPAGAEVLAPSGIIMSGEMWTDSLGLQPHDMPREMTEEDIQKTIAEYVSAARNAVKAGFDGVELHGANGYLITQFLDPGSNRRTDQYGGDPERRNRFALEIATEVAAAIGPDKVGIRLSPYGVFNDMSGTYSGIDEQYLQLADALGRLRLVYMHMVDHSSMGAPKPDQTVVHQMCHAFKSAGGEAIILSGGYDKDRAEADLQLGMADMVAFGRPFISNPDLIMRLREGGPIAVPDEATFYTPGETGYTDYPNWR